MHRHVRRNRFHADFRQFTGAVLRFLDGTLPREREAIAESVTDSFRMITHDGYRMAAWPPARPRANQSVRYGPVQFREYKTVSGRRWRRRECRFGSNCRRTGTGL